jgi:hypothetical protein
MACSPSGGRAPLNSEGAAPKIRIGGKSLFFEEFRVGMDGKG